MGEAIGSVTLVSSSARPEGLLSASIFEPGALVAWAEQGDLTLPPEQLGASRILVHRLDASLALMQPPNVVDTTQFYSWGTHPVAALDWPRSLLWTWSDTVSAMGTSVQTVRMDCKNLGAGGGE